jgi:hypothetical protein
MASEKLCVCDRTRENLIGTKLDFVDTVHLPFVALVKSLSNVPETGLWLNHFRGIPKGPRLSRFDVIYLDERATVLSCVENFTEVEFKLLEQEAASAVILAAHSLAKVNVQPGDQLRVCRAGKVLAGFPDNGETPADTQICIREGMAGAACREKQRGEASLNTNDVAAPATEISNQKLSLKQKFLFWLFPKPDDGDRRRGKRLPAANLVAYYWTGGAPQAYKLAEISQSGLYLFTEERWLPGTRIVMTLQRESDPTETEEISRVESEVVRWGEDGVAFRFVESGFVDLNTGQIVEGRKFDRAAFDQFLHRVVDSEFQ